LPEAFVFPFRGSGFLVLIVVTILLSAIKLAGAMGGLGLGGAWVPASGAGCPLAGSG
jgi:hypothetical protein